MSPLERLPLVIPVHTIAKWLREIFPEGTPNRNYVIRDMAAKTLFVMLYTGAVEGTGRWLRPDQVTKMTDRQAAKTAVPAREKWSRLSVAPGAMKSVAGRWYASNTREPIRDETLRAGFVALGVVAERTDLPTTSAKPRYAITRHFADLISNLAVQGGDAKTLVPQWQERHLTADSLRRISLLRRGRVRLALHDRVVVALPSGESRLLRPGPSSSITKAVVEDFARRFLREPGVIFMSESAEKIAEPDHRLAEELGFRFDYSRNLPDVIRADIQLEAPKVVFVEAVATDGAVTEQRKQALLRVASAAGVDKASVYFVSAFLDRSSPAFRKAVSEIAWGTFGWFTSEPDKLLIFRASGTAELASLFVQ